MEANGLYVLRWRTRSQTQTMLCQSMVNAHELLLNRMGSHNKRNRTVLAPRLILRVSDAILVPNGKHTTSLFILCGCVDFRERESPPFVDFIKNSQEVPHINSEIRSPGEDPNSCRWPQKILLLFLLLAVDYYDKAMCIQARSQLRRYKAHNILLLAQSCADICADKYTSALAWGRRENRDNELITSRAFDNY